MVSWYLRSNPNEDALRQGASIRNITSTHYISTLLFKLLFSSGSEYICFLKPIQFSIFLKWSIQYIPNFFITLFIKQKDICNSVNIRSTNLGAFFGNLIRLSIENFKKRNESQVSCVLTGRGSHSDLL